VNLRRLEIEPTSSTLNMDAGKIKSRLIETTPAFWALPKNRSRPAGDKSSRI
jgi:hypothetical protein